MRDASRSVSLQKYSLELVTGTFIEMIYPFVSLSKGLHDYSLYENRLKLICFLT